MFVVLLLLDVCSRFEIASPTGYKKGTQKNYFYNRPFFGPLLDELLVANIRTILNSGWQRTTILCHRKKEAGNSIHKSSQSIWCMPVLHITKNHDTTPHTVPP